MKAITRHIVAGTASAAMLAAPITETAVVLRASSVLVTLAALTACAKSVNPTALQIQNDVQAIATGLQGLVDAVSAIKGVPATVIQQATTAVKTIEQNASSIAIAVNAGTGANSLTGYVQAVVNAVQTLDTILTPFFPQAPAIAAVVQAALALAQIIIGMVPAGATTLTITPAPAVMSESQARAFLNSKPLVK